MIALGMAYAVAVGIPIALASILLSSVLRRYGRAERGVWLGALGLSIVIPVAAGIAVLIGRSSGPAGAVGTGVIGLPELVVVPVEATTLQLDALLVSAWIFTSAALALRWIAAVHSLERAARSWRAGTVDGVPVILTDEWGPAVAGVLRPRVLAPSWMLTLAPHQRALVLMHEQEHVRARDPLLLATARATCVLLPWNPVVWFLAHRLRRAVETDCDRRVLRANTDVAAYGETLLTVSARRPSRVLTVAAFAETSAPLRARILAMTTPPRAVSVAALLSTAVLGVVLLVGALQIPVPSIRLQLAVGDTPRAPGNLPAAAVVPVDGLPMPSTTRPALVNREEVVQVLSRAYEQVLAGEPEQVVAPVPEHPTFTPMSVQPRLLNPEEVIRAMARAAPPGIPEARGTLLVRIDRDGNVTAARIDQSSGVESFDAAVVALADMMRFAPARNRDQGVPVWASIPFSMGPATGGSTLP